MSKSSTFSSKKMFTEIGAGPDHILLGHVKPSEAPESSFMLCELDNSQDWIEIADRLVKKYEFVGRSVKDGSLLPIARVFLAEPGTAEAAIFAKASADTIRSFSVHDTLIGSTRVFRPMANIGGGTDCAYDEARGGWYIPGTKIPCRP